MTSSAPVVDITVVVSTVDRPLSLARCLSGLIENSRRPVHVVVVDQGDDAGVFAVIADARGQGLDVTHIRHPRRGLSFGQNAGFRAATSAVVAVVDDDCVPDPLWIEVVETAFAAADRPLLLTGRVLPQPARGDRTAAVSTRDSTVGAEWTRPPMPWHIGTGGNYAVTRAAYDAVGGNDERLGTGTPGRGANDLDLFYRLIDSGVLARYEPRLVVNHERSTVAEYQSRRFSYGFGLGAMAGLWLRAGRLRAVRLLAGWLRLRARVAMERRRTGGVRQEIRVLLGTAAGLGYGLRAGGRPRTLGD
jgi:glycosyltransferase involved in cell wall biosynthesis